MEEERERRQRIFPPFFRQRRNGLFSRQFGRQPAAEKELNRLNVPICCMDVKWSARVNVVAASIILYSRFDSFSCRRKCMKDLQGLAKRWALGCVNLPPVARGSQEAVFTQPRARYIAHPCSFDWFIWSSEDTELLFFDWWEYIVQGRQDQQRPPPIAWLLLHTLGFTVQSA